MVKKVVWSDEAILTFNRVIEFLEENWSKKEIQKFVLETDRIIKFIAKNPLFSETPNITISGKH